MAASCVCVLTVCLPVWWCRRKVILTAAKQVAKWTLPSFVCRDNLGKACCCVDTRLCRLLCLCLCDSCCIALPMWLLLPCKRRRE